MKTTDFNDITKVNNLIESLGEGPCKGCSMAFKCQSEHLACRAFYRDLTTGKWKESDRINPTKGLYQLAFNT